MKQLTIQEQINNTPMEGGICILASAGTGKTYCLVEKIKHCIANGINPINILAFTFTVDSAQEFRNRIPNNELMTVGTMHSVMLKIIKEHSRKSYYVLEGGKQMQIAFEILKELKIDFDKAGKYLGKVGLAKNTFLDYYEMLDENSTMLSQFFGDNKVMSFATEYEKKKEHLHKIDFDDFTLKAYWLLKDNPDVLDSRQERWKYIFADEAQDLCPPQIAIIKLLAGKYKNLLIVGDVKQSIYQSFRAATPSFLQEFAGNYPNASIFELPTTYRNSLLICNAGNAIASKIDNSEINTKNESAGKLRILPPFASQREEAVNISSMAIDKFNQGNTVRILYRTNAQSLTFQQVMLQENIPFSINQTNSIFLTKEAKTAIACCKYGMEYDSLNLAEKIAVIKDLKPLVGNKFALYALTKKMQEIGTDFIANKYPFEQDPKTQGVVYELLDLKNQFSNNLTIPNIFNLVANICKYDESFSDSSEDNLIGIAEFASECKTVSELKLLIDQISKPRLLAPGEKAICLSTIHGSKGLESDIVYVTGCVDGCIPHSKGLDIEEMNLWYVAVTRAREELYISSFLSFGRKEFTGWNYQEMIRKVADAER